MHEDTETLAERSAADLASLEGTDGVLPRGALPAQVRAPESAKAESAKAGPAKAGPPALARRRRWIGAVAVGAALLAAAGVVASTLVKSPSQAAADAGPPERSVLTAPVEHRVLTSSVIVRGQVGAGQSVDVAPQVSGGESAAAPVVTKLAVKQGDTLRAGQLLMEVSGRPVFVLPGRVPVYRDLKPGAEGDDVRQLQQALRGLGHGTGADAAGVFGSGTKSALNSLYTAIGYDPLPALDDNGDGIRAAEDAVTQGRRAVEEAQEAADAQGAGADADRALRYARQDLAKARQALTEAQSAAGPRLPAGEVVFLQGFPARVDAVPGRVGSRVEGTVMTVSAGRLIVQAYLQEYQKGLVRKGQRVRILSELTGVEAAAHVASVATSMSLPGAPGGGGGDGQGGGQGGDAAQAPGQSGYLLRIDPDKRLPAELVGQDVRLTIEAARTDGKALVVPVTALTAGADGRTTVTVLAEGGARRRVEVRTGTAGDGFVAVEPVAGAKLAEGEKVITGVKNGEAK
ncbi:peptidoglycan-binding protein [Streptomyces polyrhachis]|uniref:Peptidoglycan-binding protein n=1 Tax=Streptomyces polyrhachis TaxID=1282885 RepID=A0ABW2GKL2_9ACTN